MVEAVVGVRLQQIGAEATKAELESMRAAMLNVDAATLKQAKDTRALARDAQALNQASQLQTRIWLAQHPAINNLTKAMSGFASAARSALAITSAFNLAVLAFNSTSSSLTELQAELREVDRQLKLTTDPEKMRELNDEAGILKAKIKELNDQMTAQNLSNWVGLGAAIAIIGEQAVKLVPIIAIRLIPVLYGLAAASVAAAIPLLIIAGIVAAIALAFYLALTPGDQFQQFMNQFFPQFAKDIEYIGKLIDDVFAQHIPNAFIFMANAMLGVSDAIASVIGKIVNSVIDGINAMIRAANVAASALGLPKLKMIANVDIQGIGGGQRIPYMESRNWGAGGAGTYSGANASAGGSYKGAYGAPAASMSSGMGGAGGTSITVNVAGNVLTVDELWKELDKRTKQSYRDRGMTGY